jgi:hypothetical protein
MARLYYEQGVAHAIALTSTAVLITTQVSNSQRNGLVVRNNGAGTAFLGFGSGVTSSNGLPLKIDEQITIDGSVPVWAVSASTSDLRVWELR